VGAIILQNQDVYFIFFLQVNAPSFPLPDMQSMSGHTIQRQIHV